MMKKGTSRSVQPAKGKVDPSQIEKILRQAVKQPGMEVLIEIQKSLQHLECVSEPSRRVGVVRRVISSATSSDQMIPQIG